MSSTRPFRAFVSYCHKDKAFAAWLQRKLEGYRLPKRLADQVTPLPGQAPGRIGPVFRDREDLSAATDQSAAVREAIAASALNGTSSASDDDTVGTCSPSVARCASSAESTAPLKMIVSLMVRAEIADLGSAAFKTCCNSPTSRPMLISSAAICRPCASSAKTVVCPSAIPIT